VATDPSPTEDLLGEVRVRAQRLIEDLSQDQTDLRSASSRTILDDKRRAGEALLTGAIAAARRLHDALNKTK
jgi:hypothetical protein